MNHPQPSFPSRPYLAQTKPINSETKDLTTVCPGVVQARPSAGRPVVLVWWDRSSNATGQGELGQLSEIPGVVITASGFTATTTWSSRSTSCTGSWSSIVNKSSSSSSSSRRQTPARIAAADVQWTADDGPVGRRCACPMRPPPPVLASRSRTLSPVTSVSLFGRYRV